MTFIVLTCRHRSSSSSAKHKYLFKFKIHENVKSELLNKLKIKLNNTP